MFDFQEIDQELEERCKECRHNNLKSCLPENCPYVEDTWVRVEEEDVIDEKTGCIIRYTMKSVKTGKEKYVYWNDLVQDLWSGPKEDIPNIFNRG